MSELKILHVIPNLLKGGAQRLVLDICNELSGREGVKVKLIVFDSENEFKHLSENIDIEVCNSLIVPSITKNDTINIDEYEKVVDTFNPDIIHSHLYLAEIVSRENVRKDVAYFTHCHDNIIQLMPMSFKDVFSKQQITNAYERKRILPRYEKANNTFISISKDTELFLKKSLPNSLKDNTIFLHNAIKTKTFQNSKQSKTDTEIRLINIGNLLDKKNQVFLLDVVEYLKRNGSEVHLILIGDGENRKLISDKIKELKLEKEVQMLGAIDNVEKYLWESDIYVHSALYEPFGLVLIEAMAAGLPVVSLDGRGNLDIVKDGENGFLINEPNASHFGEKILLIDKDEKLYKKLSNSAVEFSQKFDISFYIDKLLQLYKEKKERL